MRMVPTLKVLTTAPVRKDTLGMINHAKVRNSTFGVPQMVQNNKKCLPNLIIRDSFDFLLHWVFICVNSPLINQAEEYLPQLRSV